MTNNVVIFPPSEHFTPEQALDHAKTCRLKEVLVIGYDEYDELVIRSSGMTRKDALWLLEDAKLYTLNCD